MQSLSICSSKGASFILPQLDLHLGSSSFVSVTPRRNEECHSFAPVCKVRDCCFFLSVSSLNSCCSKGVNCRKFPEIIKRSKFFLSGNSKLKSSSCPVDLSCSSKPNRDIEIDNGVDRVDFRALGSRLKSAKTVEDVEKVLNGNIELPLQVYSTIIKTLGKSKQMDSAMALLEWLKRKKEKSGIGPNVFIYNSLLGAVKNSQQFGEIEKILYDMVREGVAANVVTYNSLMAIYVEKGEGAKALSVFEEIKERGFVPTPVSYSTALLAYEKMEDGNGALKCFVEFRESYTRGELGIEADGVWEKKFSRIQNLTFCICFQVMRDWLVKDEGLANNVFELLADMDTAGVEPNQRDYEHLVRACTREEHYVIAKKLYCVIRERYSKISLSVCNHLISLMGKAEKWGAALEVYEDLLDKGPEPNQTSYELIVSHFNTLLIAASREGNWKYGVELINKMEEKGIQPRSKEWDAALIACSKASETAASIQIFTRMMEQGERPTIISFVALLSALKKGKLYNEAIEVWDHMIVMGITPNAYAYTVLASIFTGQGNFEKVDVVFKEMAATGIEPTVVTYNTVISGCAETGTSNTAYEWFQRMEAQNITPDEITYEMLIDALAKDGKPRLAYELYLRSRKEGFTLSPKAYDAIVQSAQVFTATLDLSVLGPRPPANQKVQMVPPE